MEIHCNRTNSQLKYGMKNGTHVTLILLGGMFGIDSQKLRNSLSSTNTQVHKLKK